LKLDLFMVMHYYIQQLNINKSDSSQLMVCVCVEFPKRNSHLQCDWMELKETKLHVAFRRKYWAVIIQADIFPAY